MNSSSLLKTLKTTLFLGQRFLDSPMRDGIIPNAPLREFEGSCLYLAAMEEELTRRSGAASPISMDERYHQTMRRCRSMTAQELQAEIRRVEALFVETAADSGE